MTTNAVFVRKVDHLGRLILPAELRKSLGLEPYTPLEFLVDGDRIILRRYAPGCYLCGDYSEETLLVHGKRICLDCAREVARRASN